MATMCHWLRQKLHDEEVARLARGSSAEAVSTTAGPASSLAPATGWVPVSRVEALCRQWQNYEQSHRGPASSERFLSSGDMRHTYAADAYKECVAMLRREIARATVRQPAPNAPR